MGELAERFEGYLTGDRIEPLFLCGGAKDVLARCPPAMIDCCMTSPPYWRKRSYAAGGIGAEEDWRDYITSLVEVLDGVKRVLRPTGSLWLNVGDAYVNKALVGLPWRIAMQLIDEGGWILRNEVIWHKVKGGPDNAADRLRNVHEHLFHLVLRRSGYHYDDAAIRSRPRQAKVVGGAVVSATGVRGIRYRRQIELSTDLTDDEKRSAFAELDATLGEIAAGRLDDFRMVIRGRQRSTHSDSRKVSGRARELQARGYYFLRYDPRGARPGDVWQILPEDTHGRVAHYAPYPSDLCRVPLLATCPPGGVALDPFCGTGTTNLVALELGRRSIGIDLAEEYLDIAHQRCEQVVKL